MCKKDSIKNNYLKLNYCKIKKIKKHVIIAKTKLKMVIK